MKPIKHVFESSDFQALVATLTVMQNIKIEGVPFNQRLVNNSLCVSAIEKIVNVTPSFTQNELRVIYSSLFLADRIIAGDIPASIEDKKLLKNHSLIINKLLPIFEIVDF